MSVKRMQVDNGKSQDDRRKNTERIESMRPSEGSVEISTTDPVTGEVRRAALNADGTGSAEAFEGVCNNFVRGLRRPEKPTDRPPSLTLGVPTDIGLVCAAEAGRYAIDAVAVLRSPECPDDALLLATDGRMLAVVSATITEDGDCAGADLVPQWISPKFAKVAKKTRTLRMAHGAKDGLFGSTRTWVDDEDGRFEPHPEGGHFPPIVNVLPREDHADVVFHVNVGMLAVMARALNSPDADCREGLTIMLKAPKGNAAADGGLMVIGNAGIGVVMPAKCNAEQARDIWRRARATAVAASKASELVQERGDAFDAEEDAEPKEPEYKGVTEAEAGVMPKRRTKVADDSGLQTGTLHRGGDSSGT